MQQLVGELHRQPFQHFFGRRAFGKLAHGVVEHLLAGAFTFIAQGANQRHALAALLPCHKFVHFGLHHRFGLGGSSGAGFFAVCHALCHVVHGKQGDVRQLGNAGFNVARHG